MAVIKWFACLTALGVVLVVLETLTYELRKVDPTEQHHHDTVSAPLATDRYDVYFRKHTRTHFGRMPWQWFKAQALQESRLHLELKVKWEQWA